MENNGISGTKLGSTFLSEERLRPLYSDKKVLVDGVLKYEIIGYISWKEYWKIYAKDVERKGRY